MTGAGERVVADNQRLLMAEVGRVRALLEAHAADHDVAPPAERAGAPPQLEALCAIFGLSAFERDVLLLCAAMELDGGFGAACAAAHGDPALSHPTFGLALAALPGAHWSALAPSGSLRRWRLVQPLPGESLTGGCLRIDEVVLHFLAGARDLDERLIGLVEPVAPPAELAPSHAALADRLARRWAAPRRDGPPPVVYLCGRDASARRAVAASAAAACGLGLCALAAPDLPVVPAERETLVRLWERQAWLARLALLIECDDADPADVARRAAAFAERLDAAVAVGGRDAPVSARPLARIDVAAPPAVEQEQLWRRALAPAELNGSLAGIVEQFDLTSDDIRAAGLDALGRAGDGTPTAEALWDACRARARPRLEDLAQRVEPAGRWEDLVLPEHPQRALRDLVLHVRHRALVNERWGFAAKSARGNGVSALFVGPSGTGKTMAAEVLARELRLDLYRIDLSAVVSKYIGETEKNLRRVFDAADQGGAILLFDEADALFGKRTEVKDSHDRYANIEVGYLLQRMEAYRGLAILTTNFKGAIDTAFLRRIRFVIQFPRPDEAARRGIWLRIFPAATPVEALDADALGRLDVTGGTIRNIAVRAAVLAAEAGSPVSMPQLAAAARAECAKLERPAAEPQLAGWT